MSARRRLFRWAGWFAVVNAALLAVIGLRYLYHPIRNTGLLARLGLVDRFQAREDGVGAALERPPGGELNYPLAPLRCEPRAPMLNVLLVVIDAMRADALTTAVAPRLTAFSGDALRFDPHYSGGNSSRSGMFSLFHGIPATYFDAFAGGARPPVLVDLLRRSGYELGLFASSPIYRLVELDRRAPPAARDVFGDRVQRSRSGVDERVARMARPPGAVASVLRVPLLQRGGRRRAAPRLPLADARADGGVHGAAPPTGPVPGGRALRRLLSGAGARRPRAPEAPRPHRGRRHVRPRHGIRRAGAGFRGHGTAYSDYQMHTPFVIRWPGHPPGRISRRTSHNDLAPTLLTEVFGCTNPPSDYSSGSDLFSDAEWSWLVAASYCEFAVIEPERVTVVFPASYEVRDRDYRLVRVQTPPRDALRAAMREMSRFYR